MGTRKEPELTNKKVIRSSTGDENLFSHQGYAHEKEQALFHMRHAMEQGEKDQWFNALISLSHASWHSTAACQSIANRSTWSLSRVIKETSEAVKKGPLDARRMVDYQE